MKTYGEKYTVYVKNEHGFGVGDSFHNTRQDAINKADENIIKLRQMGKIGYIVEVSSRKEYVSKQIS